MGREARSRGRSKIKRAQQAAPLHNLPPPLLGAGGSLETAGKQMAGEAINGHDMKALLAAQPRTEVLRDYHWTATMFYRALNAGAFGFEPKVELIRGRLVEHPGQTPRHANTVNCIGRRFREALEPALEVREHCPIAIADDTHVDTDILVVKDLCSEYEKRHPGPEDTLLLVEVADASVEYDLGEKASIYAQAGIAEYWVVLVQEAAIVVHRKPTSEGYRQIAQLSGTNALSPLAMPEVVWSVNALLGR